MDEKDVLISIYQNCSTATQSINDLVKKTEDKRFKDILNAQYERYIQFSEKVEKLAEDKGVELKDNSWLEKVKLWSSIQMGTITDNSTRHLAELMLVGSVMGTITCYKTQADHENASKEALDLLNELEELEENNFDELKKYLKNDKE